MTDPRLGFRDASARTGRPWVDSAIQTVAGRACSDHWSERLHRPSDDFVRAFGFMPRRMADMLALAPSHVQDRWQARLYTRRPLLRLTLSWPAFIGLIIVLALMVMKPTFD